MAAKKNKKSKKQRRPRHQFTDEFRADVVRLCQSDGESISEISRRLDLTESAVRGWVKKAEQESLDGGDTPLLTAMSDNNDTALALAALDRAPRLRKPPPGLIHHSDRGSPYGSDDYIARLDAHGIIRSTSGKGDCWDNAVAESLFSTLELECRGLHAFADLDHAQRVIGEYFDRFYDIERLHSTIDYPSPIEYEVMSALRNEAA